MKKHSQLYHPKEENKISENIYRTSINGLFYIQSVKHNDDRGFFSEVIKNTELNKTIGYEFKPKQINLARNIEGTAKGLHAEGWNKLVFVTSGKGFSALVDIRPNSKTFKQIEYFELGFDYETKTGNALFITQGIANSLISVKDNVNYVYLVDRLYSERDTKDNLSISMFDPELNIDWPISKQKMIISQRDKDAITLRELLDRE